MAHECSVDGSSTYGYSACYYHLRNRSAAKGKRGDGRPGPLRWVVSDA